MPKVSVIVPVYNVEKYIEKCLESLVNQTLKEIEIIFVNDGSPDNSQEIIDQYVKKYPNKVKSYIKENGGQSSARNYGLKQAKGDFIAFVDSDDYVDKNMLKLMYDKAVEDDLDIVLCGAIYDYNSHLEEASLFDTTRKITPKEYMISPPCPWNKIYKRKFLEQVEYRFEEGIIYEDLSLTPRLTIYTDKIGYINKCLYYYVQHANSTMNISKYNIKTKDIFKSLESLYDFFEKKGKIKQFHNELEHIYINHLLMCAGQRFYMFNKHGEINKISDIMREKFPKWYKNPCMKNFTIKEKIWLFVFYYKKTKLLRNLSNLIRRKHVQD